MKLAVECFHKSLSPHATVNRRYCLYTFLNTNVLSIIAQQMSELSLENIRLEIIRCFSRVKPRAISNVNTPQQTTLALNGLSLVLISKVDEIKGAQPCYFF